MIRAHLRCAGHPARAAPKVVRFINGTKTIRVVKAIRVIGRIVLSGFWSYQSIREDR